MITKEPYRLIISGGGTGGHVFPAIAIANAFRERHKDADILFVGAQGKMEMIRVPDAGYRIVGLWIAGIKRSLSLSNIMFPIKLIVSYWKARNIVRSFRPHAAVGTGGYASGPLMLGYLTNSVFAHMKADGEDLPSRYAGLAMCSIFILGLIALPFLPETKDQPLPE